MTKYETMVNIDDLICLDSDGVHLTIDSYISALNRCNDHIQTILKQRADKAKINYEVITEPIGTAGPSKKRQRPDPSMLELTFTQDEETPEVTISQVTRQLELFTVTEENHFRTINTKRTIGTQTMPMIYTMTYPDCTHKHYI